MTSNVLLWHWGRVGAGAKFTCELAREMRSVPGLSVGICAAQGSELATLAGSLENIPVHRVRTFEGNKSSLSGKIAAGCGLLRTARLATDFRRTLDALSVDVAICTMLSIWDIAALGPLRRSDTRFVLVLHDAELHAGDWYPFRATLMAREIAAADALVVLSEHVRRGAASRYRFPERRIWTVPHGAFEFGSSDSPRSYPTDRPLRLLFFGRILPYKGLNLLLQAYGRLRDQNVPVELEILGSGQISPYLSLLTQLPGILVRNRWASDAEIGDALARADIVVLPYLEASQSGVAAAAHTAALPVVVTPVGGLVEQVKHGRTGVVARGMSAADLADAIRSLVEQPTLYEQCSEGARRYAREELDWMHIAESMRGIVQEVMALPPRRNAHHDDP